jgi:hypothetical protein
MFPSASRAAMLAVRRRAPACTHLHAVSTMRSQFQDGRARCCTSLHDPLISPGEAWRSAVLGVSTACARLRGRSPLDAPHESTANPSVGVPTAHGSPGLPGDATDQERNQKTD